MYFVYIIRTLDNSLYIGVTEDLERRVESHDKRKAAKWTTVHRGAHCVFTEAYSTLGAARKREIQLKKWSRAKKEAL
ncbi:MAG TPA: GIY-YIG nuclease family protein, partial [Chthoniobacterales bacterium]